MLARWNVVRALVVQGELFIHGPLKMNSMPTEYTLKGFIKRYMKLNLIQSGLAKPIEWPHYDSKGPAIIRLFEISPKATIQAKMKHNLEPLSLLFIGVTPVLLHADRPDVVLTLKRLMYNAPRLRIVTVGHPEFRVIEYQQGARDDLDTISTTNPHPVKLWYQQTPWKFRLELWLSKYDGTKVPEFVEYTPKLAGLTYAEAYREILLKGLKLDGENREEIADGMGGRSLHKTILMLKMVEDNVSNGKLDKLDLNPVVAYLSNVKLEEEAKKLMQVQTQQKKGWY